MIATYFLYNSILLLSSFFAYCGERVGNKRDEYLCRIMVFLILWIPASFRSDIGTDYSSYQSIYEHIDWYIDELEIGYVWLNQIFRSLSLGHEYMFSAVAALTYAPICFGMPKKGYSVLIIFYILTLYLVSYNLVRQSIAISFSLYAAVQLLKGRNVLYFVIIIGAVMFHVSALLLLLFFFLKYIRFNIWVGILVTILGSFLIIKFDFISIIFGSDIFLSTSYGRYATSSFNKETEMGSGLGVMVKCIIPFIILFFASKIETSDLQSEKNKNGFLVGLSMAYIFAQVLSVQIHIFNRLVDIVSFMIVLGIGIIYLIRWKYRKIILLFLSILFLTLFEKNISAGKSSEIGGLGISPYKSILNE